MLDRVVERPLDLHRLGREGLSEEVDHPPRARGCREGVTLPRPAGTYPPLRWVAM
jgi:hypothetical protein